MHHTGDKITKHNVRYKIVCNTLQLLEDYISRYTEPFLTILHLLESWASALLNEPKIVKNGSADTDIWSSKVVAVSQTIL